MTAISVAGNASRHCERSESVDGRQAWAARAQPSCDNATLLLLHLLFVTEQYRVHWQQPIWGSISLVKTLHSTSDCLTYAIAKQPSHPLCGSTFHWSILEARVWTPNSNAQLRRPSSSRTANGFMLPPPFPCESNIKRRPEPSFTILPTLIGGCLYI